MTSQEEQPWFKLQESSGGGVARNFSEMGVFFLWGGAGFGAQDD